MFYKVILLQKKKDSLIFQDNNSSRQSGCRIGYQANALSNVKDTLKLTRPRGRWISHSFNQIRYLSSCNTKVLDIKKSISENKKFISRSIKDIFNINRDFNVIDKQLKLEIPNFVILLGNNSINNRWINKVISDAFWKWSTKKFKGLPKGVIYENYWKPLNLKVSKVNYPFLPSIFIEKNNWEVEDKKNIKESLKSEKIESCIYLFYLKNQPLKFYLGSSESVSLRFSNHYNNALKNTKRHPKFYSAVQKYGWNSFKFLVLELCDTGSSIEREQVWLDKIFSDNLLSESSLNLHKISNSSKGYKHTVETRKNMSLAKLGYKPTEQAIKNMSLSQVGRLSGSKHHQWKKPLSLETKAKISLSLKGKGKNVPSKLRKKIFLFNSNNELVKEFCSMTEGRLYLKIGHLKLSESLNKGEIVVGNMKFYLRETKKD